MAVRIRLRYDDKAVWESSNATLARGEFAVVNDNGTISVYVGDSDELKLWSECPVISTSSDIFEGIDLTNLSPGDILYYTESGWTSRSLKGGNRISIVDDGEGNVVVSYFETVFAMNNPTIQTITNTTGTFTTSTQEVGTAWSGSLAFRILRNTGSSTVGAATGTNGSITHPTSRLSGWSNGNFVFNNNTQGDTAAITGLSITTASFANWFNPSNISIGFTATGIKSSTTDNSGNTIPETTANSTSVNKNYGWRFWGFTSEDSLSIGDVQGFVTNLDLNSLTGGGIITNPNTKRNIFWDFDVATVDKISKPSSRYLYFAVTTPEANTNNYQWTPQFYPPGVLLPDDQFEKIGSIQLTGGNNFYYTIYRANIQQIAASASFDVGA